MLDTGSFKTLLRADEFRKIGSPTLRLTSRVFKVFGIAQSEPDGVFDAELEIDGELYQNEVYVVPVEVMDSKMLLGKEIQNKMNINIQGGRMTIQKITMKSNNASTTQEVKDNDNRQHRRLKNEKKTMMTTEDYSPMS